MSFQSLEDIKRTMVGRSHIDLLQALQVRSMFGDNAAGGGEVVFMAAAGNGHQLTTIPSG